MTWLRRKLRRWLSTEEIPRAIGLMLVLVFVIAVGGVSLVTYLDQRGVARKQLSDALGRAVELLVDRLEPAALDTANGRQLLLMQFAARYPCRSLRLYGEHENIVASVNKEEIGQVLPIIESDLPIRPESKESRWITPADGQSERLLVRAPMRASGAGETLYLEVLLTPEGDAIAEGLPIWALTVALSATAALLVVYRRLRRDMSSVTRIADNLVHNSEHLVEHFSEMRLPNAQDPISDCWNRLVDHAAALEEEVSRSNASTELLAALSRTDAGELAGAMVTAPIGVVLAAENGGVLYANAMARRVVGWSNDDGVAISFADQSLSPDGQRIVECIRRCHAAGGPSRALDARVEGSDGSFYDVQVVPVRSSQQSPRVLAIVRDVSQQVRADKAREEFVSQVTHELRTPLTNIRAYAETLSSGMFDDPQVITECYNVITKETRRLSRLVEDILSISQLEVGTMQLVIDNVDLRALLTEAARDVRGLAEAKTMDVQLALPSKLPAIKADRDKLAVVINNLLGNALKYTPENGQVTLSCKATDANVQISVRDNGIGIDPKDHGKIFEKFQRADDAEVMAETGTGIGLTTAREIVHQHGGDITVMSKKGEGATFTVTLPVTSGARQVAEPLPV